MKYLLAHLATNLLHVYPTEIGLISPPFFSNTINLPPNMIIIIIIIIIYLSINININIHLFVSINNNNIQWI